MSSEVRLSLSMKKRKHEEENEFNKTRNEVLAMLKPRIEENIAIIKKRRNKSFSIESGIIIDTDLNEFSNEELETRDDIFKGMLEPGPKFRSPVIHQEEIQGDEDMFDDFTDPKSAIREIEFLTSILQALDPKICLDTFDENDYNVTTIKSASLPVPLWLYDGNKSKLFVSPCPENEIVVMTKKQLVSFLRGPLTPIDKMNFFSQERDFTSVVNYRFQFVVNSCVYAIKFTVMKILASLLKDSPDTEPITVCEKKLEKHRANVGMLFPEYTVQCSDGVIKVNTCILALAGDYFVSLLQSEMIENDRKVINLPHTKGSILLYLAESSGLFKGHFSPENHLGLVIGCLDCAQKYANRKLFRKYVRWLFLTVEQDFDSKVARPVTESKISVMAALIPKIWLAKENIAFYDKRGWMKKRMRDVMFNLLGASIRSPYHVDVICLLLQVANEDVIFDMAESNNLVFSSIELEDNGVLSSEDSLDRKVHLVAVLFYAYLIIKITGLHDVLFPTVKAHRGYEEIKNIGVKMCSRLSISNPTKEDRINMRNIYIAITKMYARYFAVMCNSLSDEDRSFYSSFL
jgi:hypothetical protein